MTLKPEDRALVEVRRILIDVINQTHALPMGESHRPIQERAEVAIMTLFDAARSEGPVSAGGAWVKLPRSAVEVIKAARNMPRRTPAPGGCSTVHDFRIQAGSVWALDRALDEFDKDSAVYGAAPPPALPDEDAYEALKAIAHELDGMGHSNGRTMRALTIAKDAIRHRDEFQAMLADRLPTTEGA